MTTKITQQFIRVRKLILSCLMTIVFFGNNMCFASPSKELFSKGKYINIFVHLGAHYGHAGYAEVVTKIIKRQYPDLPVNIITEHEDPVRTRK